MKHVSQLFLILVLGYSAASPVFAAQECKELPSGVQAISVNNISQNSELQKLDNQLDDFLQPCLQDLTPQNSKAICANARVVAEQVLRVVARIDDAGKRNDFLANAKLKSYKTASGLLDRMRKFAADKTCR